MRKLNKSETAKRLNILVFWIWSRDFTIRKIYYKVKLSFSITYNIYPPTDDHISFRMAILYPVRQTHKPANHLFFSSDGGGGEDLILAAGSHRARQEHKKVIFVLLLFTFFCLELFLLEAVTAELTWEDTRFSRVLFVCYPSDPELFISYNAAIHYKHIVSGCPVCAEPGAGADIFARSCGGSRQSVFDITADKERITARYNVLKK